MRCVSGKKPSLGTLNANIVEMPNNLEVFGSKKTKEPKQESKSVKVNHT
jgi:hypothetical protein